MKHPASSSPTSISMLNVSRALMMTVRYGDGGGARGPHCIGGVIRGTDSGIISEDLEHSKE